MTIAAVVAALAAIPWQWDGAPDLFARVDLAAGKHAVALKKKKVILRGPAWSVAIVGRPDQTSGAALATDGARVFVAVYNRAASGCSLAAFDGATGKPLWSVGLEGIGPILHSMYSNRVEMRIISGHPTVFGNESAKRYIEQRDAATGALVSHQLLPPERRSDPLRAGRRSPKRSASSNACGVSRSSSSTRATTSRSRRNVCRRASPSGGPARGAC